MLKNYIAFALFTVAIIGGWLYLRTLLPKPEFKKADEAKIAQVDDKQPEPKGEPKVPEKVDPKIVDPKIPGEGGSRSSREDRALGAPRRS